MTRQLRPTLEFAGQRYVDEEVRAEITRAKPLDFILANIFEREMPARIDEVVGHDRKFFNWVKPDGKGGFVPRKRKHA